MSWLVDALRETVILCLVVRNSLMVDGKGAGCQQSKARKLYMKKKTRMRRGPGIILMACSYHRRPPKPHQAPIQLPLIGWAQ